MSYSYCVYVIELDDPMVVYVGQSYLSPEERLKKHRSGVRSSRHVRNAKNPKLRPDLYQHLPKFESREAALGAEEHHAKYLEGQGFTVEGGH